MLIGRVGFGSGGAARTQAGGSNRGLSSRGDGGFSSEGREDQERCVEGVFRYAAQPRWMSHLDRREHSFPGVSELPPRGVAMPGVERGKAFWHRDITR